jgi:hypothetical protein
MCIHLARLYLIGDEGDHLQGRLKLVTHLGSLSRLLGLISPKWIYIFYNYHIIVRFLVR